MRMPFHAISCNFSCYFMPPKRGAQGVNQHEECRCISRRMSIQCQSFKSQGVKCRGGKRRRFWHPIRMLLNLFKLGVMDQKWAGEEALRASGVSYTIIRPGRLQSGPGGQRAWKITQARPSGCPLRLRRALLRCPRRCTTLAPVALARVSVSPRSRQRQRPPKRQRQRPRKRQRPCFEHALGSRATWPNARLAPSVALGAPAAPSSYRASGRSGRYTQSAGRSADPPIDPPVRRLIR